MPFMTMELVDGPSLEHLVGDGGLPLVRFFDIGITLADPLSAAHRKGIIHRDLKPADVMITDDGIVKVLDFGLARETGRLEALSAVAAGRRDDAIAYARAAWNDREPTFTLFARHFLQWRPPHADPRFQAILREMDAPAEDVQ